MKLATLSLVGVLFAAAPAFADSLAESKADVNADVKAIHKDNVALAKDHGELTKDRAEKAAAKANGDTVEQAKKSIEIGADHTVTGEKNVEKAVDQKILDHHEKELDKAKAAH